MIEFSNYRFSLFLLALAMASAGGKVRAQENVLGASSATVVLNRKQATKLLISQLTPDYPPVAKVNYLVGHVQVLLTVDGEGKVANAHVLGGNAVLAASALKATRQWVYHPLVTPAGPSAFMTTVEVKFIMDFRDADLTPQQAERDFLRSVKPPQVVRPEADPPSDDVLHLHLLVNDQGEVDDLGISPVSGAQLEAAREALRGWTFRPAHWGTLPIASYLDVEVPLSAPSLARAAVSGNL